ncbi:MAG TPA: addiction module protein [Pyrinomonadaceae bacterium]
MERNLKNVLQEAIQLPERDRATLAGLLIETLDPISESESEVEAAWSAEIDRRVAEIDAGEVELIPWEVVRAELFEKHE